MAKALGNLTYHRVPLTIRIDERLYASSPTSPQGIDAALMKNMPTDAQYAARREAGEILPPLEEVRDEMTQSAAASEDEERGEEIHPTAVFRRDNDGRVFLHSNYLKGSLRDSGEVISRELGFWGLHAFVTKTLLVTPARIYLGNENVRCSLTKFAPEVRRSTGIMIRQPTEKVAEYVDSPTLRWVLYLQGDPRWTDRLLESLVIQGAMRGIGPGRTIDESKFDYVLGDWQTLLAPVGVKKYREDFYHYGEAEYSR